MTPVPDATGLLVRFLAAALQLHLLGVLFARWFRPEQTAERHLLAEDPADPPGASPTPRRVLLRALRQIAPPALVGAGSLLLPDAFSFSGHLLGFLGYVAVLSLLGSCYLYLTHRSLFLREALPTVASFIVLLSLSDTVVHFTLTSPALRGALDVRLLGASLGPGTVLAAPGTAPGAFEFGSRLLLLAILILWATLPGFVRDYPKSLRLVVVLLAGFFGLIVSIPAALYAHRLSMGDPYQTFRPGELFLLLAALFFGQLFFFLGAEMVRRLELERRARADREAELAAQRFYNEQMRPIVESLREQRHGRLNNLAVLVGLVRARDWAGLDRFVEARTSENERSVPVDEASLHRIHSAALLGVLSAKADLAHRRDVRLNLWVDAEVTDLPVPVFPLCEILGILLDNAVEAAEAAGRRLVQVRISAVGGGLAFRISNTFGAAPDLDRLGTRGYTTKGEGHGNGLAIVRTRLRGLKGVQLETCLEGGWFSQELRLPAHAGSADPSAADAADAAGEASEALRGRTRA